MKIAWLTYFDLTRLSDILASQRPFAAGHACSWIVSLSRALAARDDVELHLVTESPRVSADQTVERDGIAFHVLRSGIPLLRRGYPGWLPWDAVTAFKASRRRLAARLRELAPDLVHAHGTEDAFSLTALDTGYPHLVSIQGVISEFLKTNPSLRLRIVQRWENEAVRRARHFTCRTHFDTAFIQSLNPAARIFSIWEAMNPVFFGPAWEHPGNEDVLFIGSYDPRKGLDHLLRAWVTVLETRPEARLSIVGGGSPNRQKVLETFCSDHGLRHAVRFLGRKRPDELAEIHRTHAAYVLPSENENSPNALSEAMVSGMPVVATDVGGVTSMVDHGTTGLVVPGRAPGPLAEALLDVLGDPARAAAMGRAGLEVARPRHDPEIVARQTVAAYEEIVNGSG